MWCGGSVSWGERLPVQDRGPSAAPTGLEATFLRSSAPRQTHCLLPAPPGPKAGRTHGNKEVRKSNVSSCRGPHDFFFTVKAPCLFQLLLYTDVFYDWKCSWRLSHLWSVVFFPSGLEQRPYVARWENTGRITNPTVDWLYYTSPPSFVHKVSLETMKNIKVPAEVFDYTELCLHTSWLKPPSAHFYLEIRAYTGFLFFSNADTLKTLFTLSVEESNFLFFPLVCSVHHREGARRTETGESSRSSTWSYTFYKKSWSITFWIRHVVFQELGYSE